MNRSIAFPCVLLAFFLFGWTGLSRNASDALRSYAVGAFAPVWRYAEGIKGYLSDRPISKTKKCDSIESSLLKLENQRLKAEIDWIKDWILYEMKIQHSGMRLLKEQKVIPAQVIYRDPSSWSSSLWIGVGEADNREMGASVIARNSPVLEGNSLVGVVDYVGKRQSRVRLITDSGVTPSVRVVRDGQPRQTLELIDALSAKFKEKEESFGLISQLQAVKERLAVSKEEVYLAKGELRGNGAPFWRSKQPILKGVGFNYDYSDAEGPSRDLRSGRPLSGSDLPMALIAEGDHLVTSGLDGVFPKGLSVAIATAVFPLKEGGFSYEIEARPTASSLNDLSVVFILPPLSGE